MRRATCLIIAVIALLVLVGTAILILNRSSDEENAIETVLAWGRLMPFPETAQDVEVDTEGSMFTRAFRVTFRAPAHDVERWIEGSPGLRESAAEAVSPHTMRYVIEPGEGAAYAEVVLTVLDSETVRVEVYTYWS